MLIGSYTQDHLWRIRFQGRKSGTPQNLKLHHQQVWMKESCRLKAKFPEHATVFLNLSLTTFPCKRPTNIAQLQASLLQDLICQRQNLSFLANKPPPAAWWHQRISRLMIQSSDASHLWRQILIIWHIKAYLRRNRLISWFPISHSFIKVFSVYSSFWEHSLDQSINVSRHVTQLTRG